MQSSRKIQLVIAKFCFVHVFTTSFVKERNKNHLSRAASRTYLHEEIMTAGHVFHDVPLDFLVFQNRHAAVDEDGRRRGLEIRAEVWRGFLHVDCRHLEADGLQFGQQVQIHEILLAEETGAFPDAIYCRCLRLNYVVPTTSHKRALKLQ